MNNGNDNSHSEHELQRLLKESLMPQPLSDQQIEELNLSEAATGFELSDSARFEHIVERAMSEDAAEAQQTKTPSPVLIIDQPRQKRAAKDDRLLRRGNPNRRGAIAALVVSALSLLAAFLVTSDGSTRHQEQHIAAREAERVQFQNLRRGWTLAKAVTAPAIQRVAVGEVIETNDREKRRVTLPDGSVLYVNESTSVSD